jgi:hypothetical protein
MASFAEYKAPASVPGRLLDVIDDYNLAGSFDRYELQPELLLQCREQGSPG